MLNSSYEAHRWGVILAGGDGTRLRPLTQSVAYDNRPKQFCPLLGGKTLLAQTRYRIKGSIDPSRTLFALTRTHEPFYAAELGAVPSIQMIVQPSNRGTLPAILYSLLRIIQLDPCASVAFFPSDHYYSNETKFMNGVGAALRFAETNAKSVILLGAAATRPEVEYGWIEAQRSSLNHHEDGLMTIARFWEKPSYQTAEALLGSGCLWNTFVMIGRATTFLRVIRRAVPGIYRTFDAISQFRDADIQAEAMQAVYKSLPVADFSREVLSVSTRHLAVFALGDIGWSDLGDPRRLVTTLFQSGIENPWVESGHCNHCGLTWLPHPDATLSHSRAASEKVDRGGRIQNEPTFEFAQTRPVDLAGLYPARLGSKWRVEGARRKRRLVRSHQQP